MHVNFSIYACFKMTRKKLHTSISGLVVDAYFVTRELIVVMSPKDISKISWMIKWITL